MDRCLRKLLENGECHPRDRSNVALEKLVKWSSSIAMESIGFLKCSRKITFIKRSNVLEMKLETIVSEVRRRIFDKPRNQKIQVLLVTYSSHRGWCTSVLGRLRYPLSPHFPFPHRALESEVPLYENTLRVVIALASFLGFGMVLLGVTTKLSFDSYLVHLDVILSSDERAICCISKELLEGERIRKRSIRINSLNH
ncbi:hypothetical protein Tco_1219011 [Tanacetum coccineum]